jgi:hypothetical protein
MREWLVGVRIDEVSPELSLLEASNDDCPFPEASFIDTCYFVKYADAPVQCLRGFYIGKSQKVAEVSI